MDVRLIDRCKPKLSTDDTITVLQYCRVEYSSVRDVYLPARKVNISLFEGDPFLAIVEDA